MLRVGVGACMLTQRVQIQRSSLAGRAGRARQGEKRGGAACSGHGGGEHCGGCLLSRTAGVTRHRRLCQRTEDGSSGGAVSTTESQQRRRARSRRVRHGRQR